MEAVEEHASTHERLHAALLRAVLGTADMHKVDETPLPPLEVARRLSERAIPDVINAIIVAGWAPPSLREPLTVAPDIDGEW